MQPINSFVFVFLLGITVINAAIPPHVQNTWKENHEKCKETSKVDEKVLETARKGTLTVDNEPLGKHILCIALIYGTVEKYDSPKRKDDIRFNDDGMSKFLEHEPHATKDKVKEATQKCNQLDNDNMNLKMNTIGQCLLTELKGFQW